MKVLDYFFVKFCLTFLLGKSTSICLDCQVFPQEKLTLLYFDFYLTIVKARFWTYVDLFCFSSWKLVFQKIQLVLQNIPVSLSSTFPSAGKINSHFCWNFGEDAEEGVEDDWLFAFDIDSLLDDFELELRNSEMEWKSVLAVVLVAGSRIYVWEMEIILFEAAQSWVLELNIPVLEVEIVKQNFFPGYLLWQPFFLAIFVPHLHWYNSIAKSSQRFQKMLVSF